MPEDVSERSAGGAAAAEVDEDEAERRRVAKQKYVMQAVQRAGCIRLARLVERGARRLYYDTRVHPEDMIAAGLLLSQMALNVAKTTALTFPAEVGTKARPSRVVFEIEEVLPGGKPADPAAPAPAGLLPEGPGPDQGGGAPGAAVPETAAAPPAPAPPAEQEAVEPAEVLPPGPSPVRRRMPQRASILDIAARLVVGDDDDEGEGEG